MARIGEIVTRNVHPASSNVFAVSFDEHFKRICSLNEPGPTEKNTLERMRWLMTELLSASASLGHRILR